MSEYFVCILIKVIILFQIQKIESLFVSVGDYSKESIPGLNTRECGLSDVAIIHSIFFDKKCFLKEYKDQNFEFFENNQRNNEPMISGRIHEGYEIPYAIHTPWVVFVKPRKWGGFFKAQCTGTLITFQWVLTAAHCFEDEWKDAFWPSIYLSVGSNSYDGTQSESVNKDKWFPHPLYVNQSIPERIEPLSDEEKEHIKKEHDLALIRVNFRQETNADNKFLVNTICLPKRNQMNDRTERAYFHGYGTINDNKYFGKYPDYLQVGGVDLHPYRECGTVLCGSFRKNESKPCKGDSGGLVQNVRGLKLRAILVGVARSVTGGTKCSDAKMSFWVSVSRNIDWILETMKEN